MQKINSDIEKNSYYNEKVEVNYFIRLQKNKKIKKKLN